MLILCEVSVGCNSTINSRLHFLGTSFDRVHFYMHEKVTLDEYEWNCAQITPWWALSFLIALVTVPYRYVRRWLFLFSPTNRRIESL